MTAQTWTRDDIATLKIGASFETLVRRILRTFDAATASDLEDGATWYPKARDLATVLGKASGKGPDHAAAAISHLSPRTDWDRNVAGAVALLTTGERMTGILGDNFARAVRSLESTTPLESFGPKAPKTRNFAANIAGDDEAVTVDVWAARVAGVSEQALGRVGVYDVVADAYRAAARRRGVLPTTMQATTWVIARDGRLA
jgi:hypothetical protein